MPQQVDCDEVVDYIDSPAYAEWLMAYDKDREAEAAFADEAEADFFDITQRVEMALQSGRRTRTSGRFNLKHIA